MNRKNISTLDKTNHGSSFNLPEEIMLMIFSYLSTPKELAQLSLVNKLWNCLANDDQVWTNLAIRNGYGDPKKHPSDFLHEGKKYYRYATSKVTLIASIFHNPRQKYQVNISRSETVEQLKNEVCEKLNTWRNPNSLFPRLTFAGKSLDNDKRLGEYNLQEESNILVNTNRAGTS